MTIKPRKPRSKKVSKSRPKLNPDPTSAQVRMYELLKSSLNGRTAQDLANEAEDAGLKISRQYFRLILEMRASDNPAINTLKTVSIVTGVPLEAFVKAYCGGMGDDRHLLTNLMYKFVIDFQKSMNKSIDELKVTIREMGEMDGIVALPVDEQSQE